tara:strand:+ start:289 stop:555 length:267 start_codon:yes stop_codon:yes gene_type:complete
MFYIIALILFLYVFSYTLKEGYLNYQDLSENTSDKNCPQMHADNYQKILMNTQMVQPYGYTKNDLFHMTRFMKTDIPLPTDPDLFYHI